MRLLCVLGAGVATPGEEKMFLKKSAANNIVLSAVREVQCKVGAGKESL